MKHKLLKCQCCGGLCPWHEENGPDGEFENTPEREALDFYDPPGCWSCCATGCRGCGRTGYDSLDRAIESNRKSLERLNVNLITTTETINKKLERGKALADLKQEIERGMA